MTQAIQYNAVVVICSVNECVAFEFPLGKLICHLPKKVFSP